MNAHRICTNWAFSIGPGYGLVTHDREESHLILFVARLLRLLPEEYHAEYAGALHLVVVQFETATAGLRWRFIRVRATGTACLSAQARGTSTKPHSP